MGNRAVITTRANFENNGVGVYLHWNGGRDSVEAFLKYMKLRGFRSPSDDCYGWARLCQVIGNYFGGGLSIGIDIVSHLDMDNYDNGVYIIDDWDIVGREFFDSVEQNTYNIDKMILDIDECQPFKEQLGRDFLSAKETKTSDIKIGDNVFVFDDIDEHYKSCQVCGFGNGVLNGYNVTEVPYVSKYGQDFSKNINNYLLDDSYRVDKTLADDDDDMRQLLF